MEDRGFLVAHVPSDCCVRRSRAWSACRRLRPGETQERPGALRWTRPRLHQSDAVIAPGSLSRARELLDRRSREPEVRPAGLPGALRGGAPKRVCRREAESHRCGDDPVARVCRSIRQQGLSWCPHRLHVGQHPAAREDVAGSDGRRIAPWRPGNHRPGASSPSGYRSRRSNHECRGSRQRLAARRACCTSSPSGQNTGDRPHRTSKP